MWKSVQRATQFYFQEKEDETEKKENVADEDCDAFLYSSVNPLAALFTASSAGDIPRVERLLKTGVKPDEATETFNYTALMAASFNGHVGVVEKLHKAGANVNATTVFGNTALMAASVQGHTNVADFLLRRQASPNAKIGQTGYTALMFAAQYGHDELVHKLLRFGADARIVNVDNDTAYDLAYNKRIKNRLIEAEKKYYY